MKKLLSFLSIFTIIFFTISCENNEQHQEEVIENVLEPFSGNPNNEKTAADTSSSGVYQEEVNEIEEASLQDALKNNTKEIVKESGMSFCDCVKKQKKITDLMMETEDDDVLKKAMADLENLKSNDCKILFATQQNTIEEKEAHERKVKQCLKN